MYKFIDFLSNLSNKTLIDIWPIDFYTAAKEVYFSKQNIRQNMSKYTDKGGKMAE